MDELKLNEILSSYRDAINALIERIDSQDDMINAVSEKCDGLNRLIFDEVINPATEAMNQAAYNAGLEEFNGKYGEQLAGYNDKLRPIEGEEFDIVKQAYDGYNEIEGDKPDEGMYVEELIKQVDEQLDSIREAIGAPADAEVAIVDNGEGEPEVQVDGQPIETSEGEEPVEDVEVTEEEESSDPEELAELEKELLNYK